jgi:hypothetical protein
VTSHIQKFRCEFCYFWRNCHLLLGLATKATSPAKHCGSHFLGEELGRPFFERRRRMEMKEMAFLRGSPSVQDVEFESVRDHHTSFFDFVGRSW